MSAGRHEPEFAHSLTDLMSGVAVMFLVIAAIFMVQASQAKKRAQRLAEENRRAAEQNKIDAQKYKEIDQRDQQGIEEIDALRTRLAANRDIELVYDKRKDPRLLTIVFSRDNLSFASGACDVDTATREAMRGTLKRIFPEICRTVGSLGTGLQKSITLEGHTDNAAPLGVSCAGVPSASACFGRKQDVCKKQGFESNVQLSAARAQYVFFQARDALKDDPVIASCLDRNFMVAGRGPMDPLDGGAWDAVRSASDNEKNRRVVIKVRVMAASVERSSP
jgi:flagellar motor protein MotB